MQAVEFCYWKFEQLMRSVSNDVNDFNSDQFNKHDDEFLQLLVELNNELPGPKKQFLFQHDNLRYIKWGLYETALITWELKNWIGLACPEPRS